MPLSSNGETSSACWREIGILGDRTCGELAKVGHCWNCAVYSNAARSLLKTTAEVSLAGNEEEDYRIADAEKGTAFVIFALGTELWALDAKSFREIHRPIPIVPVPHRASRMVAGLAVLRGEILTVARLRRLLGCGDDPAELPAGARLAIVNPPSGAIGFLVDQVLGVRKFPPESLESPPASVSDHDALVTGMMPFNNSSVAVLSAAGLFAALEGGMR